MNNKSFQYSFRKTLLARLEMVNETKNFEHHINDFKSHPLKLTFAEHLFAEMIVNTFWKETSEIIKKIIDEDLKKFNSQTWIYFFSFISSLEHKEITNYFWKSINIGSNKEVFIEKLATPIDRGVNLTFIALKNPNKTGVRKIFLKAIDAVKLKRKVDFQTKLELIETYVGHQLFKPQESTKIQTNYIQCLHRLGIEYVNDWFKGSPLAKIANQFVVDWIERNDKKSFRDIWIKIRDLESLKHSEKSQYIITKKYTAFILANIKLSNETTIKYEVREELHILLTSQQKSSLAAAIVSRFKFSPTAKQLCERMEIISEYQQLQNLA